MKKMSLIFGFIAAVACNQMSLTQVPETDSGKIRFLAESPGIEMEVSTTKGNKFFKASTKAPTTVTSNLDERITVE